MTSQGSPQVVAPSPSPARTANSIAKARERAAVAADAARKQEEESTALELVRALESALPVDPSTRLVPVGDLKRLLVTDIGGDTLSYAGAQWAVGSRLNVDEIARDWAVALCKDRSSEFGATLCLRDSLHAGDIVGAIAALKSGANPNRSAVRSTPAWALAVAPTSSLVGDFSLTHLVSRGA